MKNHIVYFMPMTKLVNFFNVIRTGNFSCDEQKGILLTLFIICMCCAEPMLTLQSKISHFLNLYSIYILKLDVHLLPRLQTWIEIVEAAKISKI